MTHSVLCRIGGYVVGYFVIRDYVAFGVKYVVQHNVAFGLTSFWIVLFRLMLFGVMSVYSPTVYCSIEYFNV